MSKLEQKNNQATRRANRVRKTIAATADRPRLSVFISNQNVMAQIIDDTKGTTLVYSTSTSAKAPKTTMTEKAAWVGKDIAKKASSKKVNQVVFDRGSKQYHGRLKALAEAARESGLEF